MAIPKTTVFEDNEYDAQHKAPAYETRIDCPSATSLNLVYQSSRTFERRKQRELSIDEFNELMLEAEMETYGDGLDEHLLHSYMWAMKPHYYSSHLSFYNYPYLFGLLFGLGLYTRYQQDEESFKTGYDDLLLLDRYEGCRHVGRALRHRCALRHLLALQSGHGA